MTGKPVRVMPFPRPSPPGLVAQAAALLQECFPDPEGYPTPEASRAEIEELLAETACLLVALDGEAAEGAAADAAAADAESLVGLVGALSQYRGKTWELHPLAVRADYRGQGLGRRLVEELERAAAAAGVGTLYLGADDTDDRTSLAGKDLFPGVLAHAVTIEDRAGHPFAFYRRVGFEVVGVIPDANGFGKPDIFMAKRVRSHA